jgi:hypothetical protein
VWLGFRKAVRMVQKKKEVSSANPFTLHTLHIVSQASVDGSVGISSGLLFPWKGGVEGRAEWKSPFGQGSQSRAPCALNCPLSVCVGACVYLTPLAVL